MVWPGSRVEIVSVATPLPLSALAGPRLVEPFLNCTVPVGVPVAGALAVDAVMGDALEALRIVSVLAWPAMPSTTAEIWRRIGLDFTVARGEIVALLGTNGAGK